MGPLDFHFHVKTMELNCIKTAIPKEWTKQIKLQATDKIYNPFSLYCEKNNTKKPITKKHAKK